MFEEIIREIQKLAGPRRFKVAVPLDKKGYFDRVCPSADCAGRFKVLLDD